MSPTAAYDPTVHLVAPQPVDDSVSAGFANVTALLDQVSLSAWLNEAIKGATDYDVIGSVVEPFSGDWEKVSTYGSSLANMSQCLRGIAGNVRVTTTDLDFHWNGNAADAAHLYFTATSRSLTMHADALDRAAKQYQALALDVWHFHEALKGLLQSIVDQGLLFLIYAAAGTALCETVIGAVAGYALAAAELAKLLTTINKAARIVQMANMAFQTGFSTLAGILKEIEDLGPIPALGVPYDHPMVR